ncbi:MAG: ABC transporter permease [Thaumarchaeota archaeon]|nr:ABC transporter permease [Nitrososphaerota archaeon]
MRLGGKIIARRVVFYVGIIAAWQIVFSLHLAPQTVIPSPSDVGQALAKGVYDGSLLYGIGTSLLRLSAGLVIAIAAGIALGIFIARFETMNQIIGPFLLGLQSIPSVAWVPLAFLWFGRTDGGIIFVTVIGALFAVAINTHSAIRAVPPTLVAAGRNMGANGIQLIKDVIIPASFPQMIAGFKQGWSYAWRGVISAEVIFSVLGLGSLLNSGTKNNQIAEVISVLIIIMIIGVLVDGLVFKRLERTVLSRWGPVK